MTTTMSLHPDHDKFSSLSFAAVVETFLETFVIGSLCSNLGGSDPETPYRAIFETKVGKNRTRHVKILKELEYWWKGFAISNF